MQGLELAVLRLAKVLELLFELLRECIVKLDERRERGGIPWWPARAQVVYEELESAHFIIVVRFGWEKKLIEGLAEHLLVAS